MELHDLPGKQFRSGPKALSDVVNTGDMIGVVYEEILSFDDSRVKLWNRVLVDDSRGIGWKENLEADLWEGNYQFHNIIGFVQCVLLNARTSTTKTMHIRMISESYLLAEVRDSNRDHSYSVAFRAMV